MLISFTPRAPAKVSRRRRAWCGCLTGPDDPPEITYCIADTAGGGLSVQAVTPTQPMPDEEEVNMKFAELVEELDLSAPNKTAMLSLPIEKKWQIWASRRLPSSDTSSPPHPLTSSPSRRHSNHHHQGGCRGELYRVE